MSDIKLRLDGADQDPKLEEVSYDKKIKIDQTVKFSPAEEKQIDDFSKKIDLEDSNIILQYGVGAQKKISNFSEKTLNTVKNKDLGEIGGLLDKVVTEIKTMDQDDGGVFGFFKKQKSKLENMKLKYQSTEKNIDEIAKALDNHQITLLKDIS
ncbi:MAG: toxic anion resistance protein, partial [Anaerococcus hydrogenalis]|nr:toxic anion resistance protein [Anaerococcus hydrogenalis]